MITIVDYGMGNLGSIRNMFKKIGAESDITSDSARIAAAGKLLLPGVGAFDAGMEALERRGLVEPLTRRVLQDGVPVLGICLGMQLMTAGSDEGVRPGLGWVPARTIRFKPSAAAPKIPHMGWNLVAPAQPDPLVEQLPAEPRFYFVHSYYVRCESEQDVLLKTSYGHEFHSGLRHGNVRGVQFHPEKSHKFGMHLLRNFAERC
jgi:glutamine amidotransferase